MVDLKSYTVFQQLVLAVACSRLLLSEQPLAYQGG
jgi:hypothetical protein